MVLNMKFNSLEELYELQRLATQADKPVFVGTEDDTIRVDARSFLGLLALDYAHPVRITTDSLYAVRQLEYHLRMQAAAVSQ